MGVTRASRSLMPPSALGGDSGTTVESDALLPLAARVRVGVRARVRVGVRARVRVRVRGMGRGRDSKSRGVVTAATDKRSLAQAPQPTVLPGHARLLSPI